MLPQRSSSPLFATPLSMSSSSSSRLDLAPPASHQQQQPQQPQSKSTPAHDGSLSSNLLAREPTQMENEASVITAAQQQGAHVYNSALSLSAARDARRSYFLNQLLVICGGCNAADAVEILAVSFILPSATSDLSMSDPEKGWLAGMIFAGMMLGGWIWGSLSDRYGRKPCLMWCLLINGLGGLLSAFAPNFTTILLCRFLAGIGVGGSVPVVFTYFSEFLCTRDRGAYMVAISLCWMVGSLFTAGLAWSIIPHPIDLDIGFIHMHSWRIFAFLCAFPSLACAAALVGAPESPRWLLSKGKRMEAKRVLMRIYQVNWSSAMAQADGERGAVDADARDFHVEGDGQPPYASYHRFMTKFLGVCCMRPFVGRIQRYLEAQANRRQDGVTRQSGSFSSVEENGATGSSSSSTDVMASSPSHGSQAKHQGSHGIKYSQLSVAAVSGVDGFQVSSAASPANGATEHTSLSLSPDSENIPSALVAASEEAVSADQFALLDEPERWRLFLWELARLEAVPIDVEPFIGEHADLVESTPLSNGDATPAAGRAEETRGLRSQQLASDDDPSAPAAPLTCSSFLASSKLALKTVFHKTISLFDAHHRWTSIKLFGTWFFLAFAYYGLTLWMPTYFQRTSKDANSSGDADDDDVENMDMYLTAVVGSLSALPANIISIFSVRIYGRIKTLVASLVLSGLCVLLVPALSSQTAAVIMLCVFSGVNTASWNALNISTTELYSTDIRATAFGFFAAMGRIGAVMGNVMFGDFIGTSAVIPLFITGAALIVAAIAGGTLPETGHLNLV
jgi:MFS family permease